MPGRYVRSATAIRVSEFLGSRAGRRYLETHAWTEGMPIIISQSHESLTDAMSLVATQGNVALVAFLDPATAELRFIYVSLPNRALGIVPPEPPQRTVADLYQAAAQSFAYTFRIASWKFSAIAHAISTRAVRFESTELRLGFALPEPSTQVPEIPSPQPPRRTLQ